MRLSQLLSPIALAACLATGVQAKEYKAIRFGMDASYARPPSAPRSK